MKAILLLIFALLMSTTSEAGTGPDKLSDPASEARAVSLQKEFRCLVCQGESLDESNAPLAADLRRLIRARILAGDSNDQVRQYLVARYGEFILMKPPLEPDTYFLWFGPFLVLVLGSLTVAMVVRKARKRSEAGTSSN